MPAAGKLIDGKYRVLSKLKDGGMGSVYKVHHGLLDEIRVLKVMRSNTAQDPELRERFLREARLFTRLSHPNIASIYDFAVAEDGSAMIVMEYIDGQDLEQILQQRGALPITEALDIAAQCLGALDYLHGEKIIHRDISPENIMVAPDKRGQRVKLIDLGIAKALNDQAQTRVGTFVGKIRYSSPEQLSPGDYILDGRTDLYSLGIVLYMLVTGVYPIRGQKASQIMVAHFKEPPVPFTESDPQSRVPDDVRQAILKAIEKEPRDRYGSAAEFLETIEMLQRRYAADPLDKTRPVQGSRTARAAAPAPAPPSPPAADEGDETTSLGHRPKTSPGTDETLVVDALRRYVAAQRSLDPEALMRVFPSADKERVSLTFSGLSSLHVRLQIISMRIAGALAEVVAVEQRTTTPARGVGQRTETRRTFALEKLAATWVIISVR